MQMQKLPPSDTALSIKMERQLKEHLNQLAFKQGDKLASFTKKILRSYVSGHLVHR